MDLRGKLMAKPSWSLQSPGRWGCGSLFPSWKVVFNPPDELHPYFSDAVALQGVLDKLHIDSHLHLSEGRAERSW